MNAALYYFYYLAIFIRLTTLSSFLTDTFLYLFKDFFNEVWEEVRSGSKLQQDLFSFYDLSSFSSCFIFNFSSYYLPFNKRISLRLQQFEEFYFSRLKTKEFIFGLKEHYFLYFSSLLWIYSSILVSNRFLPYKSLSSTLKLQLVWLNRFFAIIFEDFKIWGWCYFYSFWQRTVYHYLIRVRVQF